MSSLDLSPSDLSETDSWGWGEPFEHSRHQVDQMRRQSRSRSRDRDTNYRHQNRDIASKSNSNKFSQSGFLHHRPHPSITRWTNVIIIQYLILSYWIVYKTDNSSNILMLFFIHFLSCLDLILEVFIDYLCIFPLDLPSRMNLRYKIIMM